MRLAIPLALWLSLACNGDDGKTSTESPDPSEDVDGDGYTADEDCDDADADVFPSALELCNGVDDDCDGLIDDDDTDLSSSSATPYYVDGDGDGVAGVTEEDPVLACAPPDDDYVTAPADGQFDCDDLSDLAFPGNPDDPPYDGIDGDCAGDNDFDPDGDGFMPPELPSGRPTEDAYTTYVTYYGLDFTLPDDVVVSPPDALTPLVLGAFDDCLDAEDPRVGAGDLDPASAFPRAWGYADTAYDGVDADCNRSNDFDQDGDGYHRDGDELALAEYVAFWGYEEDAASWGPAGPALPGDCDDTAPDVHPSALEVLGDGVDDDCDGLVDSTPFAFAGAVAAPVIAWDGVGTPRVMRLGDTFGIALNAAVVNQPGLPAPLAQNTSVVLPFPIAEARSGARPDRPPQQVKTSSSSQVIGPAFDVVSLDRCAGLDGEDLAYISLEYEPDGALSTFTSIYTLAERADTIAVANLGVIGAFTPAVVSHAHSVHLDGNCEVVAAGIADDMLWVSHGFGLVADLALATHPELGGQSIAASFDPTLASGPAPQMRFTTCDAGACTDHTFGLDVAADADPVLISSEPVLDAHRDARSVWTPTEDRVVTSLPFSGPGVQVHVTPSGAAPFDLSLFDTDDIVAAHGTTHEGDIYVAAILDQKVGRTVALAYGPPASPQTLLLPFTNTLPAASADAAPTDIAVYVDSDRIAVALTLVDETAGIGEFRDAVGWAFLGTP